MLAEPGRIADQVGGAGLQHLDAVGLDIGLVLHLVGEGLLAHALLAPEHRVHAALQVAGVGLHPGDGHHLVGVQVEQREDGLVGGAAPVLVVVVKEQARGARHAGDIGSVDEAFGAQGVGIAHQKVHGLLLGGAVGPLQHRLFSIGQDHHWLSRGQRAAGEFISMLSILTAKARCA